LACLRRLRRDDKRGALAGVTRDAGGGAAVRADAAGDPGGVAGGDDGAEPGGAVALAGAPGAPGPGVESRPRDEMHTAPLRAAGAQGEAPAAGAAGSGALVIRTCEQAVHQGGRVAIDHPGGSGPVRTCSPTSRASGWWTRPVVQRTACGLSSRSPSPLVRRAGHACACWRTSSANAGTSSGATVRRGYSLRIARTC